MIILEGLDATGKSTLAEEISTRINWPIQISEGPEKEPGEIIKRAERYLALPDHTIFDRHPIISQSIYGPLANKTLMPLYLVQELKRRQPMVIEAAPTNILQHQPKEHDTPEHLDMIHKKRFELECAYARFFIEHFRNRLIYRLQFRDTIISAAVRHAEGRKEHVN